MKLKQQHSCISDLDTDKPLTSIKSQLYTIIQYFPNQSTMNKRCTPVRNETSPGRYWTPPTIQNPFPWEQHQYDFPESRLEASQRLIIFTKWLIMWYQVLLKSYQGAPIGNLCCKWCQPVPGQPVAQQQQAHSKHIQRARSFPPETAHAAQIRTGSPAAWLGELCSFFWVILTNGWEACLLLQVSSSCYFFTFFRSFCQVTSLIFNISFFTSKI